MTHQRVKNVSYDDDYADDDYADDDYADDDYDKDDVEIQLRAGTVKAREALGPLSKLFSDTQIQESLYHYYYDVAKTVNYLRNSKEAKADKEDEKQPKPSNAPDLLQTGDSSSFFDVKKFFQDCPWLNIPAHRISEILETPRYPRGGLLGGSSAPPGKMSKLAALAAKRRQKENEKRSEDGSAGVRSSALASLRRPQESRPQPLQQSSETSAAPTVRLSNSASDPTPRMEWEGIKEDDQTSISLPDQVLERPSDDQPSWDASSLQAQPSAFAQALFLRNQGQLLIDADPPGPLLDSYSSNFDFSKPSPDDIVLKAQSQSKPLTGSKADSKAKVAGKKTVSDPKDSVENGLEQLKISAPSKVKSKNFDVVAEFRKTKRKNAASFVVIGHVDSGKSTLMGRLLFESKAIDERTMAEYEREAEKAGKGSFAFAWLMDQGREERERGVTINVATSYFETDKSSLTILDAPGHQDFVPNMIGGTSDADFAVLVVDASPNEFERGLKGQTREHALLARSMGLNRVIVAVNKMDRVEWSEERFTEIQQQVQAFLTSTGFKPNSVAFVPCSGLRGDNIAKECKSKEASWYTGLSLVQELDASKPKTESIDKPFRMTLSNVYDEDEQPGLFIAGRIETGNLQLGDELLVIPGGERVNIRSITVADESRDWAVAGTNVSLGLTQTDPEKIRIGFTLCSLSSPARAVNSFTAIVLAFDHLLPLPLMVHKGHVARAGKITKLVATLDSGTQEAVKKKPKVVHPGKTAKIEVELEEPAVIEAGRVVLRAEGNTVAAGNVL